jgi:hypothetical protein
LIFGGLDVGGRQDYTALVTLRLRCGDTLEAERVRRVPIGYEIVDQLPRLAADLATLDALAIDVGGVGAAVPGLLRGMDLPCMSALLPVAIVAGVNQHYRAGRVSVGKMRLVCHLEAALRECRLTVDSRAPGAAELREELQNFVRGEGGVRAGAAVGHDDLTVALALAVWCADTCLGRDTALAGFPANFDGRLEQPDDWRRRDWRA